MEYFNEATRLLSDLINLKFLKSIKKWKFNISVFAKTEKINILRL